MASIPKIENERWDIAWRGFAPGSWQSRINVREFIQRNMCETVINGPTAISTPGANWVSGRPNGLASALPTSASGASGNDREIQHGPLAQATWGPVTIGGYWFNPRSIDQVFVGMIGATF